MEIFYGLPSKLSFGNIGSAFLRSRLLLIVTFLKNFQKNDRRFIKRRVFAHEKYIKFVFAVTMKRQAT